MTFTYFWFMTEVWPWNSRLSPAHLLNKHRGQEVWKAWPRSVYVVWCGVMATGSTSFLEHPPLPWFAWEQPKLQWETFWKLTTGLWKKSQLEDTSLSLRAFLPVAVPMCCLLWFSLKSPPILDPSTILWLINLGSSQGGLWSRWGHLESTLLMGSAG